MFPMLLLAVILFTVFCVTDVLATDYWHKRHFYRRSALEESQRFGCAASLIASALVVVLLIVVPVSLLILTQFSLLIWSWLTH